MQEVFLKLIAGDFYQNLAFGIIIGLSFLFGMLVWALLAHIPASRKLKKQSKELDADNKVLKKDNKDLSERYTVINAKYSRSSEDLQTAEANLKEKNEKVDEQREKIRQISEQLELYKDNARNFKESNEKLMEAYKTQSAKNEKLEEQTEGMKGIVEEVEQEKGKLIRENQLATDAQEVASGKLKTTTENLSNANETVGMLKKDLDAALAQKAALKKTVLNLEAAEQLSGTDDTELKTKLVGLKSHVRELELENSDLMQRLAPYLAKELSDRRKDEEIDELLVNLLVDAEQNMEKDGFYVDYHEDELIEDKQYLEKTLGEEAGQDLPQDDDKEEVITLDVDDEAAMNEAMSHVTTAMNMQGFYAEIEKAVLIQEEGEALSDDNLMDLHLDETAKQLEGSFFFNEGASEEGFIENEELLAVELEKIKNVEDPADSQEAVISLDDADHGDMDAALEVAMSAMNAEGLYAPIDAEKLMGTEEETEEQETNGTYQTDLEHSVVQEIGRSIPKASANDKDDLQQIDGIGMFVEQRLNQFGIYTYEQISQFDATFVVKLGAALGFSEQTIARDKWVEQAQSFLKK